MVQEHGLVQHEVACIEVYEPGIGRAVIELRIDNRSIHQCMMVTIGVCNVPDQGIKEVLRVLAVAQLGDLAAGEIAQGYHRPVASPERCLYALEYGGALVL